ncbi:Nickel uptake substrate-specific transmembrane region, partial [Durusdinium trenchii]
FVEEQLDPRVVAIDQYVASFKHRQGARIFRGGGQRFTIHTTPEAAPLAEGLVVDTTANETTVTVEPSFTGDFELAARIDASQIPIRPAGDSGADLKVTVPGDHPVTARLQVARLSQNIFEVSATATSKEGKGETFVVEPAELADIQQLRIVRIQQTLLFIVYEEGVGRLLGHVECTNEAIPARGTLIMRFSGALTPLVLTCQLLATVAWADDASRTFEWNVNLDGWKVLGPFPKESDDPTGLITEFVDNESQLRAGRIAFHNRKLLTWRDAPDRVVNLRTVLDINSSASHDQVAYAWNEFESPVEQTVRLSIGYDDHMVAWLNGEEILRGTDNLASALDQSVAEVSLREGRNTLLVKVSNGTGGWDVSARLLPAKPEEPLLTFYCVPGSNLGRLPVVEVELLDEQQAVIARHRSSGGRQRSPNRSGYFALYAQQPDVTPAFVRYFVDATGFDKSEVVASWDRARRQPVTIALRSDRPQQLVVVDGSTGQPVVGARIWSGKTFEEQVTDENGHVVLPGLDTMSDRCFVAAKGYTLQPVSLKWPRRGVLRAELKAGGRTLAGTVVSTDGTPITGAELRFGTFNGYAPTAVTDENGRFEVVGLPDGQSRVYPVISASGFVARDRFVQNLSDSETSVQWELTPGATITGQVIERETGRPAAGVRIVTGEDRFGSNTAVPEAITNAEGRYTLTGVPSGGCLVHAFSDDYAPEMKSVTASLGEATTIDFEVSVGEPVTGTIADPEGNPVPGVRLITDTWNGARMFEREARTDTAGRFTLAHMPPSEVEVHVLKQGFMAIRDLNVSAGDHVDVTMRPHVLHIIQIRDAKTGGIVPDLQIARGYLWSGNQDWNWRSDEWYTTRLYDAISGEMRIEIDEMVEYDIAYRFRAAGYAEAVVKLPRNPTEGETFSVQLEAARMLVGRVVDAATGQPQPGVIVAAVNGADRLRTDRYSEFQTPWQDISNNGTAAAWSTTDEEGRFKRPADSGTQEGAGIVLAAKEGGFCFIPGTLETLLGPADSPVDLPFPASGSITGQVLVAGQPIANTKVHVQWLGTQGGTQNDWNRSFGVGGSILTDAEGRFRFTGLGPGQYQLSQVFDIPLGERSSMTTYLGSTNVTLHPGQQVEHNLGRPPGHQLAGVARTSDGRPLAGSIISLNAIDEFRNRGGRLIATTADEQGRFVLEHVPEGTFSLMAEHYALQPGRWYDQDYSGTMTLEVEGDEQDIEISMAEIVRNSIQQSPTTLTGSLAPEFSVTLPGSDQPFVLSEHFGDVTAVIFMVSHDQKIATLNEIYEKFRDRDDVHFVFEFSHPAEMLPAYLEQASEQPVFPIHTSNQPERLTPLVGRFGTLGQFLCYVIGRDGRFASEAIPPENLVETIERALATPLEEPLAGDRVAEMKVAGARYENAGVPHQLVWHYPPPGEGGKVMVTLRAPGIEEQTQEITDPGPSESITFRPKCPRVIRGTAINIVTNEPAEGVPLRLHSQLGHIVTGTSDAEGHFEIPVFPEFYYGALDQGSPFAFATLETLSVSVGESRDPAPLKVSVAPSITLAGKVLDTQGVPVPDAVVAMQNGDRIVADEKGEFELGGIPAAGPSRIWASQGQVYGAVMLTDPQPDEVVTIRLGEGVGNSSAANVPLAVISFDWDIDQARRESAALGTAVRLGTGGRDHIALVAIGNLLQLVGVIDHDSQTEERLADELHGCIHDAANANHGRPANHPQRTGSPEVHHASQQASQRKQADARIKRDKCITKQYRALQEMPRKNLRVGVAMIEQAMEFGVQLREPCRGRHDQERHARQQDQWSQPDFGGEHARTGCRVDLQRDSVIRFRRSGNRSVRRPPCKHEQESERNDNEV